MAFTQKSRGRGIRGALLVAMCLCSLWSLTSRTFTQTEEVTEDASGLVKLVGGHPLIFTFLSMALCGALCYTENSTTAKLDFDKRDYFTFQLIQNILCFASGLINALCIFDMGMTVSHQSGNTSHTGRLIMNGGAAFGHLLLAFCFGSFFAGYSKADTELIYSGRYSPNLLAAALAVVAGCMVHYCKEHGGDGNDNTSECLLLFAFSQGIQNGITRRCQTLPICTTHFTGYLTDVGTLLGWCARDGVAGEKFLKAWAVLFQKRRKRDKPCKAVFFHAFLSTELWFYQLFCWATRISNHQTTCLWKTMLFAAGIFFFGLGGVAAKELHESFSVQAALIAAALMAAVAGGLVPVTKSKTG